MSVPCLLAPAAVVTTTYCGVAHWSTRRGDRAAPLLSVAYLDSGGCAAVVPDPGPINVRYPTSSPCGCHRIGGFLGALLRPPTPIHHPPSSIRHHYPAMRRQDGSTGPLTLNRLRFSRPGCVLRALRLSGISVREAIGCPLDHASARDCKRVGLDVAPCLTVTSKVKSRMWSTPCIALGPASFRPSFKPLEERDTVYAPWAHIRHRQLIRYAGPPAPPAGAMLARRDAAADAAATPHNVCGRRPVP